MKRSIYSGVLGAVVLATVIVAAGRAQVYPVRWEEQQSEVRPAAPMPPSLVLADGGLQFPDGSVQTTAAGDGPLAKLPRTGQTTCYDAVGTVVTCGTGIGLGQDGDLQLGVVWPNPRFTKNGDGTVTDNLTNLIWLENADCAGAAMNWAEALAFATTLFDGSVVHNLGDCGLSDGSAVGAWRLPNIRELQSLVHYGVMELAVPNTAGTGQWAEGDPFSGVEPAFYWSSTTSAALNLNGYAWVVNMTWGTVGNVLKTNTWYVWPVRGGQ